MPDSAPRRNHQMALARNRLPSSNRARIPRPGFARRILIYRPQTASARTARFIPPEILKQKTMLMDLAGSAGSIGISYGL